MTTSHDDAAEHNGRLRGLIVENVPSELRDRPQWLVWRWEQRAGKRTKPPYQTDGSNAKGNDPRTWTSFERAIGAWHTGRFDGIGFVLTEADPYVAWDLDHCRDPETGELDAWAREIVEVLDSYTEVTPSDQGLRVLVRAKLPPGRRRRAVVGGREGAEVEVYETGRYVTVTGYHFDGTPACIEERDAETRAVYMKFLTDEPGPSARADLPLPGDLDDRELLERALTAKNGSKFHRLWMGDGSGYQSQSEADLALCSLLAFWTGGDPVRMDRLFRQSGLYRRKWDERHSADGRTYGQMTTAEALKRSSQVGRNGGTAPAATRPAIFLGNRQLREVTEDALGALQGANDPPVIFQRGGELVRVERDEGRQPVITVLGDAHLRGHLTRAADFFQPRRDQEPRAALPPLVVARDILALGAWPFPPLVGVTEAPVLRPDGSLAIAPGYDPATRLSYVPAPGLSLPPISDSPTRADAEAALETLEEAVGEFPFADQASRANTLGLLLTPVVRPMISGHVPLAVLDAPTQGAGKTLLADLVAVVATGRDGAMMDAPEDDEEWDKRITAALREGATVILVDNVMGVLRASSLSRALTCSRWAGRILGRSEMVDLPQRATWIVTGNNVQAAGDMPRRCYWVRLDPMRSRPWERSGFARDPLLPWVRENRGRLLGALITMARAWVVAGRPSPQGLPVMGSFETWVAAVGGILAHAGVGGFLANARGFQDRHDAEEAEWEAFLLAWQDAFGDDAVTAADVAHAFDPAGHPGGPHIAADHLPSDLADAWSRQMGGHGGSFTRKFGKALSRREGTRHGTSQIHVVRDGEQGRAVRWRVVSFPVDSDEP